MQRRNWFVEVELYKDNFEGQRTVILTQTPNYTLSQSLLESWKSRQKSVILLYMSKKHLLKACALDSM